MERARPLRIRTILTDTGKEFTDRLFGLRKRATTGAGAFDKLCAALDIDHPLAPPKSPQTNGMVARVNGRTEEVLQSRHFRSGEELQTTLHRYVRLGGAFATAFLWGFANHLVLNVIVLRLSRIGGMERGPCWD